MDSYESYGIVIPNSRTSGEVATICPKCSPDRKPKNQKAKCLGVNLDKKVWKCNHCSWAGALRVQKQEIKTYQRPTWKNNTTLSANAVKFFEGRGISQSTINKMKITEGPEWVPQVQKERNTIQFNYFRDGELVNVKYRDGEKNFKMFKDAEKILYNIDCLKDADEIYLVEGEMDTLSFVECDLFSVSVPNGANVGNNNLEYLDACIDLFNGKKIHLAFDNDSAGRKLRDDVADRFGRERCDFIDWKDCKDANEVLMKYGKRGVKDCLTTPIQFPLEGVYTISDYENEIDDMYLNGLDRGVSTEIEGFDLRIVKGYISVIVGIPSHGKSDKVDNIALKLRIKHDWRGAFYSPENKPTQLHFSKMARKLIGKAWDGPNRMGVEEKNLVKRFLDKFIWFIKPEKDFSLTSILGKIRELQYRHGLDYFVIDAWNKLEHLGRGDSDYIGRSLDELAIFCEARNLHCFLVVHPTKMKKGDDGKYMIPTLYDCAGSANFYNKTDNGVCVYRDFETDITTVYRQKIKFDHWGTEGESQYKYDKVSKRYNEISRINFDTDNWIEKDEFFKNMDLPLPKMNPGIDFTQPSKIEDCPF